MDAAMWLEAVTTIATVLAVVLALWAIVIAKRAVELQRKVALQDVTINVRQALAGLTAATGEFNAQLIPFWRKPAASGDEPSTDPMDQRWTDAEVNLHSQVHRIQGLGRSLSSELDALFAFAPQAWIDSESVELKSWIEGFCTGAWFAPYSALVSDAQTTASPRSAFVMADYLLRYPHGRMRGFALDRLFDDAPSLPQDDAAQTAIAFYEAAERCLVDGVSRAVSRGAHLVAVATPLDKIVAEPWLGDALPSATHPAENADDASSSAIYAFLGRDGSRHEGTLRALVCLMIPDYVDHVFDARVALARRQQTALHHLTVNQERVLARLDEDGAVSPRMRDLMTQPKASPAVDPSNDQPISAWDEPHPLFLLTSHYAPHTDLARPTGSQVVWIDPTTEETLLHSFGILSPLTQPTVG